MLLHRNWIYKNLKRNFIPTISLCDTKIIWFGIFHFKKTKTKTGLKRSIGRWYRKKKRPERRCEFELKLNEFWQIICPFSFRISVFSSVKLERLGQRLF